MEIKYIEGDATAPIGPGQKIIIHCCNDIGIWGAGFVIALTKKWPEVEKAYKQWHENDGIGEGKTKKLPLGEVQFVPTDPGIEVGNMIGQRGVGTKNKKVPPIRYNMIREALRTVAKRAQALGATVHAPKFGAGLAGGVWEDIEALIIDELIMQGIEVTVYEFTPPPIIEEASDFEEFYARTVKFSERP